MGVDDFSHDAVLQPLGAYVGEAEALVEASGAVVEEGRGHLLRLAGEVVGVGLDDATARLRDECQGALDRELRDTAPPVAAVDEDAGDPVVRVGVLLGVVLLAVVDAGQLGRRAVLRPGDRPMSRG